MGKMIDELKNKALPLIGYLYLALPIFVFCIGYLKWYFIVASVAAFLILGYFVIKKIPGASFVLPKTKKDIIKFFSIIALIVLVIIISGIGNNGAQTTDLYWRNTIFEELVTKDWPASQEGYNTSGEYVRYYLVYYIGFYMVPAAVGKMFGLSAGYAFISIWAIIGLIIVYFSINSYYKRIVIMPFVFVLFFSGLDLFAKLFNNFVPMVYAFRAGDYYTAFFSHLEWMTVGSKGVAFELSAVITQLFWTFNNAIPMFVMIAMCFLLNQKKNIILLTSLLVLPSTLVCFGVAVIIIVLLFVRDEGDFSYRFIKTKDEFVSNIKEYVINPGTILAIFITLFTGTYVLSNSVASSQGEYGFRFIMPFENPDDVLYYILFIFFELLIYYLYCFKNEKRNVMFHIAAVVVIIFTLIRIGDKNDFMFKATTPFLFLMSLWFTKSIYIYKKDNKASYLFGLLLFALSLPTSLNEILRLVHRSIRYYSINSMWNTVTLGYLAILFVILLGCCCSIILNDKTIKNVYKKLTLSGIMVLCLAVTFISITIITNCGMGQATWNPQADSWIEIYLAENFSGKEDSLFFKYFGRTTN